MDRSSRIFYGMVIIAIIGLIFKNLMTYNQTGGMLPTSLALVLVALVALSAALMFLLLNPFARVHPSDHRQALTWQSDVYGYEKKMLQREIEALEAKLKTTTAQKKRYITLWRKAKGYTD